MATKNSKRILVGKSQRKNAGKEVSHDEISQAIRHFQEQGGLIKELPPQRDGMRHFVGGHLGSAYENVIDH